MAFEFENIYIEYVRTIVETTFGFNPIITMTIPAPNKVAIVLNGTEQERSLMMGKEAGNFKAIKLLLRAFARRHGDFSYLFMYPYTFENQYELKDEKNLL
jgi:hypothetical protein